MKSHGLADRTRAEKMEAQRLDLILSCPNFGGRTLADDKNFICREFDMVALENLSLRLKSGGRLVIVLPGRITFASGKINDLRRFVQTSYTTKKLLNFPREHWNIQV